MPRRHISQREAHETEKELKRLREHVSSWARATRSYGDYDGNRLEYRPLCSLTLSDFTRGKMAGMSAVHRGAVFVAVTRDDGTAQLYALRNPETP